LSPISLDYLRQVLNEKLNKRISVTVFFANNLRQNELIYFFRRVHCVSANSQLQALAPGCMWAKFDNYVVLVLYDVLLREIKLDAP